MTSLYLSALAGIAIGLGIAYLIGAILKCKARKRRNYRPPYAHE